VSETDDPQLPPLSPTGPFSPPPAPSPPDLIPPPGLSPPPGITPPAAPPPGITPPQDAPPPLSAPPAVPFPPAAPAEAPSEPEPEPDPVADLPPAVGEDTDESPGDPFEGWPASESSAVIEDTPLDGSSVEHVRGEVDVPDGYTVLEGTPLGNRRSVGVVVSRFNGGVTNRMLRSALDALIEAGVSQDAITVMPVPGAFELPLAAMALAKTRRYACIVALGALVRGDTAHFEYIASECASGLQLAGIETGVPVSFGVLTVENVEQAEARIDKAAEAARSALEMADLFARLRASARQ
jgi:6,7-dimethyl-8-ribityllumazine synthase